MLKINFPRLQHDLETFASIGVGKDHGLYRMAFSDGDMQGRQWLMQRIEEAGLELYVDGAANICGRLNWDGKKPSVMTGSHIDTIPGAGHLEPPLFGPSSSSARVPRPSAHGGRPRAEKVCRKTDLSFVRNTS